MVQLFSLNKNIEIEFGALKMVGSSVSFQIQNLEKKKEKRDKTSLFFGFAFAFVFSFFLFFSP